MEAVVPTGGPLLASPHSLVVVSAADPDPNGDLTLLLGGSRGPIRVSSKVMGLASRVFKAMVNPDFLPKELCVDDPPGIPLPEDDPVAIYWICTVLHHREWTHGSLPTPVIKDVAILCDKYDCAVALKPWSAMFLFMLQSDQSGSLGVSNWQTVWMSRAFDDHDAFTRSTSSLVWQAARELRPDSIDLLFHDEQDSVGLSILPDRLWFTLEVIKTEVSRNLDIRIHDIIEPYLTFDICGRQSAHGLEVLDPGACVRSAGVAHFFQELHRLEVFPLRQRLSRHGLAWVTSRLRSFKNYYPNTITNCICLEHVDFRALIVQAVEAAERAPRQLCLNCAKHGNVTDNEGNCRAVEKDRCKLKQPYNVQGGRPWLP